MEHDHFSRSELFPNRRVPDKPYEDKHRFLPGFSARERAADNEDKGFRKRFPPSWTYALF